MKRVRIAIVLILGILLVSGLACSNDGGGGWFGGPKPEIVGLDASEHWGWDYVITVECHVRNNGDSGNVKVTSTLQNGSYWTKSRTVYIAAGQTEIVEIDFPEAEFLGQGLAGFSYTAWAE